MLKSWGYLHSEEVLLVFEESGLVYPFVISKDDFNRAFGCLCSVSLADFKRDFEYRFLI